MNLQELNQLDFSNIGDWPAAVKGVLVILLCGVLGGGWYYLFTEDQLQRLEQLERKEQELRTIFEVKQKKAANLDAYKQQLAEMKESFGAMLRQLPDKTEVAALLVDVSQTGLASGLEFQLFQPTGEVPKDFYAELPINIKVTGQYHQFGDFVSGLAALPRIVTIHNIAVKPIGRREKNTAASPMLMLQATAKTYRYLDEETDK